jgi:dethiobiotin synthetase
MSGDHALLTAQAIANDGLPLIGWVANRINPGLAHYAEIPTTISTGSCSCTTHSESGRRSFIRLRQPPVPSTTMRLSIPSP